MTPRMRRRRWIRARRFQGRDVPRPFTIRVSNCASVSFGESRVQRIFATTVSLGNPDAIFTQETFDVIADNTPGWNMAQVGAPGSPESALVIGIRATRGELLNVTLLPGVPATSEGGGFRKRPMLAATLDIDPQTPHHWRRRGLDGHANAERAPRARRRYLAVFRAARASIKAGDLNIRQQWAARLLYGQRVHSVGVLHLAIPAWIPQTKAVPVDVGSDHLAFDVTLWPNKETR